MNGRDEFHPVTPVLCDHARQRCAEMGISTKVAKRILQAAHMTFPGNKPGIMVARSPEYPQFRVVYRPGRDPGDPAMIITILWEVREYECVRDGAGYRPKYPLLEGDGGTVAGD